MADAIPALPEGFTLDQPTQAPPLPEGFTLDAVQPKDPIANLQDLLVRQSKGEQGLQPQITTLRESTGSPDVTARFAGGFKPTPEEIAQLSKEVFGFDPLALAKQVKGVGEVGGFLGASTVAKPVSGLGGLATTALEGSEAGAEEVARQQKLLTPELSEEGQAVLQSVGGGLKSLAELPGIDKIIETSKSAQDLITKAFEVTGQSLAGEKGKQVLGSIGQGTPQAIIEGALIKGAIPKSAGLRQFASEARIPKIIADTKAGTITDDALKPIAEVIKKGTDEDLAKIVNTDKEFFRAADELGVNVEPLASFASKNPQFRAVEGGLASVPSSALDVQTKAFISNVSQKADDLIEQFGGTLDKGQLNIDFKRAALTNVENLAQQADDVYGSIAKVLPKSERFAAPETVGFIQSKIKELGGIKELPPKLRAILNNLESKTKTTKGKKVVNPATGEVSFSGAGTETINPTLGKIDQIRREVGQALNKKSGAFKDTEQGLLKALYARLSKDQDAIAETAGFGDITKSAKGLITQRKVLEDNITTLLGKDLNQALSVNVAGAVKGLAKNDIARFNSVIQAIPKNQRQSVVLTAMNDVFKGSGVGQQSLNPTQFTKWFQTIERSPAVKKALFENLPAGSPQAIQNLFKVSSGISRALGDRVTTGRLNAMFNEETGFIRRMVGRAAPSVVAAATGSPSASFMTNASLEFLQQSTNGAKRAADMLASPQFQAIIRRSVKEGVIDGNKAASQGLQKAETAIKNTKPYKQWVKALSPEQQKNLNDSGLIGYLFINELEEGQ